MKKFVIAATLAVAAISTSACATMTRGTSTAWEVTSDPTGAEVHTSNGHHCPATPCSIKMPRKSEFTATLTLDGYEPATVSVTNRVSGGGGAGMAGNVLVGGLIGAGVDVASGAMLDLTPNPATVTLRPKAQAAVPTRTDDAAAAALAADAAAADSARAAGVASPGAQP